MTTMGQVGSSWSPTWLSLAGAITWVVSRDKELTEAVDRQLQNDCDIILGITARLANIEIARGSPPVLSLGVDEAWPLIRGFIADEKIVAEGKSVERRGMSGTVETRFSNAPIPSGDAGNLIILNRIPGISPKDALGPNEMYRFHNYQGRYWYDVRLRAGELFDAFPMMGDESKVHPVGPHESMLIKPRGGRPKGTGSYASLDEALLDEMHGLIEEGHAVSPEQAAKKVAEKAKGAGSVDSKAERLAKRYRASPRYSRNKSDNLG